MPVRSAPTDHAVVYNDLVPSRSDPGADLREPAGPVRPQSGHMRMQNDDK
jgi:hypothetical protein